MWCAAMTPFNKEDNAIDLPLLHPPLGDNYRFM